MSFLISGAFSSWLSYFHIFKQFIKCLSWCSLASLWLWSSLIRFRIPPNSSNNLLQCCCVWYQKTNRLCTVDEWVTVLFLICWIFWSTLDTSSWRILSSSILQYSRRWLLQQFSAYLQPRVISIYPFCFRMVWNIICYHNWFDLFMILWWLKYLYNLVRHFGAALISLLGNPRADV